MTRHSTSAPVTDEKGVIGTSQPKAASTPGTESNCWMKFWMASNSHGRISSATIRNHWMPFRTWHQSMYLKAS